VRKRAPSRRAGGGALPVTREKGLIEENLRWLERSFRIRGRRPRWSRTHRAVRAENFIFVSGQGPMTPVTDKLFDGRYSARTRLVLGNLKRILEAVRRGPATWCAAELVPERRGDFKR